MTCLKDYLHYRDEQVTLLLGDALAVAAEMADDSVDCIVTSPPYFGLRDYGTEGQYGLESSPAEYVESMRRLFAELRRVLADDGTLWLNLGDSYIRNPMKGGSGTPNGRNEAKHGYPVESARELRKRAWREGAARADGLLREDGSSRRNRNGCMNGDLPEKNLLGIPWRVAFALQDDGWILRNAIIWHKPNAMPESVADRLSGRYEHVFLFSKSRRYWFDLDPIREPIETRDKNGSTLTAVRGMARVDQTPRPDGQRPSGIVGAHGVGHTGDSPLGRNPGDVWSINTQPFSGAHFAVYPVQLPQRCILAGCKPEGTVLDPFNGSGTTGLAAQRLGRKYVGIDVNAEYLDLSLRTRLHDAALDFNEVAP